MARILIIGGAGLVGRHLVDACRDHDVVVTHHRDVVPRGIALDITDGSSVHRTVRDAMPAAVILAAAEPFVERCEKEPEATRRVNVDAASAVRDAAIAVGATLVVFSSEYVFDGTRGRYVESDATAPLNEYGRQKVALEQIARATDRHLVLRTSGVFGDEPKRKNFVLQLVDRLRSGATFDVPSDQLITPTYAKSLAEATVTLVEQGAVGTFHIAGPTIMERVEFARAVTAAFGLPADRIRPRPTAELGLLADRPRRAGLATRKARSALGHDLTSPDEALAEMARSAS